MAAVNRDVTVYPPSKRRVVPPKLAVLLHSDAMLIECASAEEMSDRDTRQALRHLIAVAELRLAEPEPDEQRAEPDVRIGYLPDGTPDVREAR